MFGRALNIRAWHCGVTGNIPRAYGSYEELLDDDEIDAVYIPLPTGPRKEWVLRACAKGKHVLCEKAVANTTRDANTRRL